MSEIKLVRARRVKALEGYRLEIVFDDDTMGVLDLSDFVHLGPTKISNLTAYTYAYGYHHLTI